MPIVIDPVMVAESGAVLLDDEARAAIVDRAAAAGDRDHAEPARGAGARRATHDDVEDLARALHALGPANVVITGGHRDEVTDVFFDGTTIHLLPGERHPDGAAHGSGCTHSSALAAHLALGYSPLEAARAARAIASRRRARRPAGASAAGPGPVNVLGDAVRR